MTLVDWLRQIHQNKQDYSTAFAFKQAFHELYLGLLRRGQSVLNRGEPHWSGDWDVLLVLDTCRPDVLREVATTGQFDWLPEPREHSTWMSAGTTSDEWLAVMFDPEFDSELASSTYITGNGFSQGYDTDRLALYDFVTARPLGDGLTAVPPDILTDKAIDAWRKRGEIGADQLIVHYMQPHTPFRSKPEWFSKGHSDKATWGEGFTELRDGNLDSKEFYDAYKDNLVWVLESIERLVNNCDADIVITADHGNGFGEGFVYGHPEGLPCKTVREVPWVELSGVDEGSYQPVHTVLDSKEISEEELEEHLRSLGYR
ncbi:hypothetical protein [Halorubrum sp. AJ67]|uniref:hypothetical protein n=1 Tax=Halorubrum sp. AJ67 TaxID=1173487 RepID=UPI0003DCAAD3|nr:hypothetical protein [Halorubrum sp. AJ67]CDK40707.1 hypothetical protein BN903_19 [Halorubrum sp. AJ67]